MSINSLINIKKLLKAIILAFKSIFCCVICSVYFFIAIAFFASSTIFLARNPNSSSKASAGPE